MGRLGSLDSTSLAESVASGASPGQMTTEDLPVPLRVGNITFDCDNALTVARFWSAALGRPLDPHSDSGFASIGRDDAERAEPAWFFEKVPEPKTAKNRMHLDLVDPDPSAVDRLLSLGASVVGRHQMGGAGQRWTVLRDPEGNEFCVADKSYTG